jgi:hypothetical protein
MILTEGFMIAYDASLNLLPCVIESSAPELIVSTNSSWRFL